MPWSISPLFVSKCQRHRISFMGNELQISLLCPVECRKHMGVSKNRGTPKSSIYIHFSRVFHYRPSILVVFPVFLETPILENSTIQGFATFSGFTSPSPHDSSRAVQHVSEEFAWQSPEPAGKVFSNHSAGLAF